MGGDIVASNVATVFERGWIVEHLVHQVGELLRIVDAMTATEGYEVVRFGKLAKLRTKHHRYAIHGCLVDIVNACAKSTADICHLAIAVER